MGWSELQDGSLDGDGPSDAFGNGMSVIVQESMRREKVLPSGESVLHAFVAALNLDGKLAPFYVGARRIEALVVKRGGKKRRIDGHKAAPWMLEVLFGTLDEVAESYINVWQRPPRLRELLHYLSHYVQSEEFSEYIGDEAPWPLGTAKFVFRDERKARDRGEVPSAAGGPEAPGRRVAHAKFGEGRIVSEAGDRLTVQFADGPRVVLRSFVRSV